MERSGRRVRFSEVVVAVMRNSDVEIGSGIHTYLDGPGVVLFVATENQFVV